MAKVTESKKNVKVELQEASASVESTSTKETSTKKQPLKQLAIILVRGRVGMAQKVKDTLDLLNLKHKNNCVVVKNNLVNMGMVKKVKDYVTWGELEDQTYEKLVKERGELYLGRLTDRKKKYNYNFFDYGGKKYQIYFKLNSPKKGFGRKGIKMPFKLSGALGYRGEKINDLVIRMM